MSPTPGEGGTHSADAGAALASEATRIHQPIRGNQIATWHVGPQGQRRLTPDLAQGSRFDLASLALYLAQPALHGEFRPAAPWNGWRLEREMPTPVISTRAQLRQVFDATVDSLLAGHNVVAVRVSGGMDSAAVLSAVGRTTSPRTRVVALVTEATSDRGARASQQAARVIRTAFPRDIETLVVPQVAEARPEWNPAGPNLDAAPARNAAATAMAVQAGATVMLSGDGADELLTTPAFLVAQIARRLGTSSALRYAADHDLRDAATAVLAAASSFLLRGRPEDSARVYATLTSPTSRHGEHVLTPRFAAAATEWSSRYEAATADLVEALLDDGDWAHAEAHLAIWPCDRLHLGSRLPIRSPFLEQPFVSHALGLPLTERWDATAGTHYLRSKAAVASLLDEPALAVLPPRKEGYARDLQTTVDTDQESPRLVEVGLVRAGHLVTDTAAAMTLHALEQWVEAAMQRGYEPARS